jgi:hypothetical protein
MKWLRKSNVVPSDPATEAQKRSIAHNLDATYSGLSAEEEADLARAKEIASPTGRPGEPSSYSHLSKSQASTVLILLLSFDVLGRPIRQVGWGEAPDSAEAGADISSWEDDGGSSG